MKTYSILIVDEDQEWCSALQEQLLQYPEFTVEPPVNNGQDALDYLEEHQPDVILLDLVMPVYDGLYVISYLHEQKPSYRPFFYVLSSIGSQKTNRVMRGVDVNYYSVKPISAHAVAFNLKRLLEGELLPEEAAPPLVPAPAAAQKADGAPAKPAAPGYRSYIEDFLYELGAPLYRLSTKCAINAIQLCLEEESNLDSIIALYERTAKKSNPPATPGSIERNIRSTVLKMQKNQTPLFTQCFPYGTTKLTNTEFLHGCVYILRRRIEDSEGQQP